MIKNWVIIKRYLKWKTIWSSIWWSNGFFVRIANAMQEILAFWDGREEVTGNSDDDFYDVVDLLNGHPRIHDRIGAQLKKAFD